jgi:WD40 repeat protein
MSTTPACLFRTTCLLFLLAAPAGAAPPRTDDHGDPLPPGAVARLGSVRLRHVVRAGSGDACVAFSPDGKTLVSGGDVGLCAWDVATGKNLGWFPTSAPANAAQFTPDGKAVLTADNNGSIRLWQAGTGKLLRETKQPQDRRFFRGSASFLSANGKVAGASDAGSGAVRVWETKTGKQLFPRKGELRTLLLAAAVSPDGKTLAVSIERSRRCLVEVATGKDVRRIEEPNKASRLGLFTRWWEESPYWFAFSPDGKSLAGMSGKDSFSVWNVADGRLRFTNKGYRGRLAFSPDGKHLVCGGEEAVRLYEAKTGKEVRRFERHPGLVHALAFSPDGRTVAAALEYCIALWDVATGKRLHRRAEHETPVVSLAFSPDGSDLASGDGEEGTLILWGLKDRKPRHTFTGHFPNVVSLAYSPDGKLLASGDGTRGTTGGFDAKVRLWDLRAGRLLRQFPGHVNSIESLAFSPDGKRLASTGHDARAKVWDVATGKRLLQIRGEDTWYRSVAFSPDGKTLLVAGTPGELALWRADSGRTVRGLGTPGDEKRMITGATFLPGGRTVLTLESDDGRSKPSEVRFWDVENGRLRRSFPIGNADGPLGCLVLSPDGNTLATGGGYPDPVIRLWDATTGKRVGRFSGHNGGPAASLAFSPDGKTLASGGPDTTVLLWQVARGRLLHLWAELAGGKDESARAVMKAAATPEEAIPFLKDRLRRAAVAEDRARRLITDLGDDDFHVREKASRELERLGPETAPVVQRALQDSPSPEARRRLRKALDKIKSSKGGDDFQARSVSLALAVLEEIGTPAARRALQELAKGPAGSTVTRDAAAALERLARRRKP